MLFAWVACAGWGCLCWLVFLFDLAGVGGVCVWVGFMVTLCGCVVLLWCLGWLLLWFVNWLVGLCSL